MVDGQVFTLDGEPVDLEELIEANRETLDQDEIEALRAMQPGESITFGGRAWAEAVVACAAAPEASC